LSKTAHPDFLIQFLTILSFFNNAHGVGLAPVLDFPYINSNRISPFVITEDLTDPGKIGLLGVSLGKDIY
jgi:hypothetical protein